MYIIIQQIGGNGSGNGQSGNGNGTETPNNISGSVTIQDGKVQIELPRYGFRIVGNVNLRFLPLAENGGNLGANQELHFGPETNTTD
jgi:hypothetical protein